MHREKRVAPEGTTEFRKETFVRGYPTRNRSVCMRPEIAGIGSETTYDPLAETTHGLE